MPSPYPTQQTLPMKTPEEVRTAETAAFHNPHAGTYISIFIFIQHHHLPLPSLLPLLQLPPSTFFPASSSFFILRRCSSSRLIRLSSFNVANSEILTTSKGQVSQFPPLRILRRYMSLRSWSVAWAHLDRTNLSVSGCV